MSLSAQGPPLLKNSSFVAYNLNDTFLHYRHHWPCKEGRRRCKKRKEIRDAARPRSSLANLPQQLILQIDLWPVLPVLNLLRTNNFSWVCLGSETYIHSQGHLRLKT